MTQRIVADGKSRENIESINFLFEENRIGNRYEFKAIKAFGGA